EVANAAAFLLSPRSSGITTQRLVVDCGMEVNYFDDRLIEGYLGRGAEPGDSRD
ncbi:MAG: SDR family oxidoreductase, partial [Bythopirellula sp.]